jgi:hypothetical protein
MPSTAPQPRPRHPRPRHLVMSENSIDENFSSFPRAARVARRSCRTRHRSGVINATRVTGVPSTAREVERPGPRESLIQQRRPRPLPQTPTGSGRCLEVGARPRAGLTAVFERIQSQRFSLAWVLVLAVVLALAGAARRCSVHGRTALGRCGRAAMALCARRGDACSPGSLMAPWSARSVAASQRSALQDSP